MTCLLEGFEDTNQTTGATGYEAVSADSEYAVLSRTSASSDGMFCAVELRIGCRVMVKMKTCPNILERVLALVRADSAF